MTRAALRLVALLWVLWLAAPARAQEVPGTQRQRLELLVTSRTQRAAFVDRGFEAGLRIGDRVTFHPVGAAPLEGVVRELSRQDARVELYFEEPRLAVGDRAEAWVRLAAPAPIEERAPPADEGQPADPGEGESQPQFPPVGSPWRTPPEEWDRDTPLLATPGSSGPAQRAASVHGRLYASARWNRTRLAGRREDAFARAGLDWTLDNPFARGGELRFAGEVFARHSRTATAGSHSDEELRLTRFSYGQGGGRAAPRRWLLGRFYPELMPEFGPLDGLEVSQRFEGQDEYGLSVGHQPRPDGTLEPSGDLAAALFHRHRSTAALPVDWRAGYQKTWHHGQADRDLFVLDARAPIEELTTLGVTAWIDAYDSSDAPKAEGLELTRLQLAAGRSTPEGHGLRLRYSEFRYPHLLRAELDGDIDAAIFQEHATRLGLDGWALPARELRLGARVERWTDAGGSADEGYSAELRGEAQRLLLDSADVGLALFGSRGEFNDNGGLRLGVTGYGASTSWGCHWELYFADEVTSETPNGRAWQQRLDGELSTLVQDAWSLSLSASVGWGDQGSTVGLGLFLQHSF
jgi:hypothetical protein